MKYSIIQGSDSQIGQVVGEIELRGFITGVCMANGGSLLYASDTVNTVMAELAESGSANLVAERETFAIETE